MFENYKKIKEFIEVSGKNFIKCFSGSFSRVESVLCAFKVVLKHEKVDFYIFFRAFLVFR